MSKRVRATDLPALATWTEVDAAMKEVGLLEMELEGMESDYNRQIVNLKTELAEKAGPLQDRRQLLIRQVEQFMDSHRDALGSKKSRELNFAVVGFRQSTSIIIRSVKATIEALKSRKMFDCISVKESVSKDELKKYDDGTLEAVGAKRKTDDTFWYEVKRDRLKEV